MIPDNGSMPYDLDRFVLAQEHVYDGVLEELRRGRKTGHWIWFIFPQVAGLGSSPMSQRFAIASLDEARAYLAHPVLGARLRECAGIVLATEGRTAERDLRSARRDEAPLVHDPVPPGRARRAGVRAGAGPLLRWRRGRGDGRSAALTRAAVKGRREKR